MKIIDKTKQLLSTLRDLLKVPGPPAPTEARLVRRYGPILERAVPLAAALRRSGAPLFQGSRHGPDALEQTQARIEQSSSALQEVGALADDLGAQIVADREELAAAVHETVGVLRAIESNPLQNGALPQELSPYGAQLLALLTDHDADITLRRLQTRDRNSSLSQAEGEISRLRVKAGEAGEAPAALLAAKRGRRTRR